MDTTLKIIRGAEVYAPEYLGRKDVLFAGSQILFIQDSLNPDSSGLPVRYIDGRGKVLLPGFVDSHVHICGGGGEGGFSTRTPEIQLSSILMGGITTVIGVLGTDGTGRTMANLLSKAYGLCEEGIDARVLTGSYQVPVRTLTGSVTDDIVLVERIVGCGEICLADHRSSHPSRDEIIRLVSDARLGGMLSSKAGIVNIHMGDSDRGISVLKEITEYSDIPLSQLQPTHMNRNPRLFEQAVDYALQGGYVDFTTSTTPQFLEEGEVPAALALKTLLDRGVDPGHITLSSDAQGSLPRFDSQGRFAGLTVGKSSSLLEAFREAVLTYGVPLEKAVQAVSTTPALRYKLTGKGVIKEGADADLLLLNRDDLACPTLFVRGRLMVEDGVLRQKGTFE